MMKVLISILLISTLGCHSDKCEEVSVLAFTHSDNNPLTIYKSINGDVLKNIHPDEEAGWITKVISRKGDYLKINIEDLKLEGWVKKGNLSLNTRNYEGQQIAIYESPDKYSKSIGYLQGEQTVKVLDACGRWAFIEGVGNNGKIQGWLEPDMQCGNPYTTCP